MGYETFATLCRINNVKPADVSRATGIATATLTNWKKGNYTPKQDKLCKIANYFNVSPDCFYIEESQSIIDRISGNLTPITAYDAFAEDFQKDRAFMEHIRLLWSLPTEKRNEIYSYIKFQYYQTEEQAKKKDNALRA